MTAIGPVQRPLSSRAATPSAASTLPASARATLRQRYRRPGRHARAIGTAELRCPFLPENYGVGLSLFTDFGTLGHLDNLADDPGCTCSHIGQHLRQGQSGLTRLGRHHRAWKSPFGPIQIDLASPIVKTNMTEPRSSTSVQQQDTKQ